MNSTARRRAAAAVVVDDALGDRVVVEAAVMV
jgi:hypothetical protein